MLSKNQIINNFLKCLLLWIYDEIMTSNRKSLIFLPFSRYISRGNTSDITIFSYLWIEYCNTPESCLWLENSHHPKVPSRIVYQRNRKEEGKLLFVIQKFIYKKIKQQFKNRTFVY